MRHDDKQADSGRRTRTRRPPKRITEPYLERSAVHYLRRYPAPSAHLHQVLMRRVRRSVAYHGGDLAEEEAKVRKVVAELCDRGLLDDAFFARARAEELHRRGSSQRAIRSKLTAKGLSRDLVDDALAALQESTTDPELVAAIRYATRRRLGPFAASSDVEQRRSRRQKDLAAMARAGFAFGVCCRVLDAPDPESVEALVEDRW
ncbi:MAG TPA: hypothetical protein DIU15_04270 [Deltaproteobacteria bacterium]|nr:regulator [Deltaproteobacteria bacterium]HCP45230.1 hypothetical protein [Deltaproteobacteria bacterium]